MIEIKASEETLSEFESMKLAKKVAYIICKIQKKKGGKGKEIGVEKKVMKSDCAKEKRLETFIADVKAGGIILYIIITIYLRNCVYRILIINILYNNI